MKCQYSFSLKKKKAALSSAAGVIGDLRFKKSEIMRITVNIKHYITVHDRMAITHNY